MVTIFIPLINLQFTKNKNYELIFLDTCLLRHDKIGFFLYSGTVSFDGVIIQFFFNLMLQVGNLKKSL
jgi:hypothetical protein